MKTKHTVKTMVEALNCIEDHATTSGHLPRELVPPHLRSAVEEVLGSAWHTIDRGDAAYLDVRQDSIEATREEYGLS